MDRSAATLIVLLGAGIGIGGMFWGTYMGNSQKRGFEDEKRKLETRHELEMDKLRNELSQGSGQAAKTDTKAEGELLERVSWLEEQLTLYQTENARLLKSIDEMMANGAKLPGVEGGGPVAEERKFEDEEVKIRDTVEEITSGIRKLKFKKPVTYTLVSWDELKEHVRKGLETEEDPGAANQSRAWAAMGFVNPGTDVLAATTRLLGSQLGTALHLGDAEIAFNKESSLFSVHDRTALAIQLVHVLQAQHFGAAPADGSGHDARAALRALAVGDTEILKVRFMLQDDLPTRDQLRTSPTALSKDELGAAPAFVREYFLFPYTMGMNYCKSLYNVDKWDSVNAAFANPPATTAEILHPGEKVAPETFSLPADRLSVHGQTPIWNDVAGELGISVLLNQSHYRFEMAGAGISDPGEMPVLSAQDFRDKPGSKAAAGWKGDRFLVYANGENGAADGSDHVVWLTAWANDTEAGEFFAAMEAALRERYRITKEDVPEKQEIFELKEKRHLTLERLEGSRVRLVSAATAEWHLALRKAFASP